MIDTIEAELAWCPPVLIPSTLGRTWLAWWIIQCDSHSRRFSTVFRCSVSAVIGTPRVSGAARGPRRRERPVQIVDDIAQVLKPHRQPDQPVADSVRRALLGAVGGMGHRRGVLNQRL